ncbi:RHS family protein [Xenorhabdus vietnamensis]|uniref:RHS family protein n=1 Tax=Xenorhabdus vietnamensis TaxID=351656 RepID=A0A1Y2S6J5_9GAMM|nr:RHS repeat-associated core domain-containing protein [Xenorhabdus vietnamensis]OTA14257.1 RHS family protein [Xenorhabdus vietnamensis]UVN17733.1 tRNA3(Ser)-specific nuclease WapA precursor [Xenorhabdus vietnamensis]
MNDSFSSQASNFISTLQTQVDPRTGQFMVKLPVAQLIGNNQLGPELSLSFSYSPLNKNNYGFGIGFGLGLTQFNNRTNLLELSSGENYRVEPGSDTVRNKKLNSFRFVYTNGHNDEEGYTVFWKEGKSERLTPIEDGETFVTTQIISPLGRHLNLFWDWSGQISRLSKVEDESTTLLQVVYDTFSTMVIWPGTADEYKVNFEFIDNDSRLDAVSCQTSETETLKWSFVYDTVDSGQRQLLTGVNSPTGKTESVQYSQINGLRFPENSGLAPLPAVLSHTYNPGSGQPETVTYYEYTEQNFLGYNGNFGDWSGDSDYLYTTLTDYTYGSTETVTDGGVTVTTHREYNNYHLQTLEETIRQGCTYRTEFTYYAQGGDFIDAQPPQFQLPREKKEIWVDTNGKSREQSTFTEFDESGNPIREVAPNRTVTVTTWYATEGEDGCPAEPNGFVRFMKHRTTTPFKTEYESPEYSTHYIYNRLGKTNYAVLESRSEYGGDLLLLREDIAYNGDSSSGEFGRITSITNTKHENMKNAAVYTTRQDFSTTVNNGVMYQEIIFTGHDGIRIVTSRTQSAYSGLLHNETDAQGVMVTHTYDKMGRPLSRTTASGTEYENTITWKYVIKDDGPVTIKTDAFGNKMKVHFDGAGRIINQQRYDADVSHQWYEIASHTFNSFGEHSTGTEQDWLTFPSDTIKSFSVKADTEYDGWGTAKLLLFSDGMKSFQNIDPVTLTQVMYNQGTAGSATSISGQLLTTFDNQHHLPLTKRQLDTSGAEQGIHQYSWDGLGRLRQETDELNNVTQRTYDVYNRVLTQTLPDGSKLSRAYAPHLTGDQVASVSVTGPDANGTTTTWLLGTQEFDSLGRVTKRSNGGRTTLYTYDSASQLPSSITLPSGKMVKYTYIPELGNVVNSMTTDGVTQTFRYDSKTGELLQATEGSTAINNTWNTSGSLESESFTQTGSTRNTAYTRTLAGKPVMYTDITGKQTHYSRDVYGRVTDITDDALTVSLEYDALGRLNSQTVKDTTTTSTLTTVLHYDDFGREVTRSVTDSNGTKLTVKQTWLKNGLLATRTTQQNDKTVRDEQYNYDNRNRLVSYKVAGENLPPDAYGNPMSEQTYHYDALNNLTSVITTLTDGTSDTATYHYENHEDPTQLTSVTHTHGGYPQTISLAYDAEGRMTQDEAGRTLTYDVTGRLTCISGKSISGGTYSYDALNRLVSQNVSAGDIRKLFYRGDELVNEVLTSQGRETRLIKAGHTCLGVSDGNGLTLTASDRNDSLLWSRQGSESDGKLHGWSPYGQGKPAGLLPGFNGERVDPVSGTYHLGNGYRAYNPILMRFNCPDSFSPFGAGGINPYAYCAGDPINHTDPSGHLSWQAITGIVAGTIGLALAVFTAGASIAAAGGVMAAISTASATSLIVGGLGVASDVTAIASGAVENINPEASAILGWVSLGTGLTGVGLKGTSSLMKRAGSYSVSKAGAVNNRLARVPAGNGVMRRAQWHEVPHNGKVIYGSDQEIRGTQIREPLERINARASTRSSNPKTVVILSGTHGRPAGNNWITNGLLDPLQCSNLQLRDLRLLDESFYREDVSMYRTNRTPLIRRSIKVVDSDGLTDIDYKRYYQSPICHVIGGYCFSRNDEALRRYLNIQPVTSFSNSYWRSLNAGRIVDGLWV